MKHARPDYDRFQDPAGKIPVDEPVFLLRGQDSIAHIAVLFYAIQAEASGVSPALTEAARRQADAMKAWANKLPDMPVVEQASLPIQNGDHAEFEREWAGKDTKTRPDWPYPSFDARDWAEAFCALFKVVRKDGKPDDGDDMGLMIGWFANALMCGLEHQRPAPATPGLERVRHLKRGIEAEVLGDAEVQLSNPQAPRNPWSDGSGRFTEAYSRLHEGDKLTIYQHDGKLWARFPDEFRDGRFETIDPATPKPAAGPTFAIEDVTADDMEHAAQKLEIFSVRDPLSGRTYTALAEILRAEAAKKRAG